MPHKIIRIIGSVVLLSSINSTLFAGKKCGVDKTDVDLSRNLSVIGTGPYFGIGSSYDGSDLVVLQPNIHKDLALLKQNQRILGYTHEHSGPSAPYVQISGNLEVQASVENRKASNLDLTTSLIDVSAWVNNWLSAYTDLGVDLADTNNQSFRMQLGFVTLGNLNHSPFYASIGQMYVPFGSFSTGTSAVGSLPKNLGRLYERALSVGYFPNNGLHLTGAVYKGKTHNSNDSNIDQFAGTGIYEFPIDVFSIPTRVRAGLSYTNNIADAFVSRMVFTNNANIKKFVPAYDAFGTWAFGPVTFRGEYVGALKHFDSTVIKQSDKPIKPESFLGEIDFNTYLFGKIAWVTLHYSRSKQGAISSPVKHQYGINASMNVLKYTILSFEFSQRKHYTAKNVLSGDNATLLDPTFVGGLNSLHNGRIRNVFATTVNVFF